MDLDLNKAASRLKKEQKSLQEKEKERKLKEKKIQEEVRRKNQELEEQAKRRREEILKKEAELEAEKQKQYEKTGGVDFVETYRAVVLAREEWSHSDRVTLPPSALNALQFKGAIDVGGPLFFELTTKEGGRTHCGVLEFVAEEETIGIPPKVQMCLGAVTEANETIEGGFSTRIQTKYVRLPKGESVSLQPRNKSFSDYMSSLDMKQSKPVYDSSRGKWVLPGLEGVLHTALQGLSTLTVGDVVKVVHNDKEFELQVLQLQPEDAVMLVDTDIQVDITPSKAEVDEMEAEEARKRREAEENEKKERIIADRKKSAQSRLTPEPAGNEAEMSLIAVKLPNGKRIQRRFLRSSTLQNLFDFIDAESDFACPKYNVCTAFPRKVFSEDMAAQTFELVGLVLPQEVVMVEPIDS